VKGYAAVVEIDQAPVDSERLLHLKPEVFIRGDIIGRAVPDVGRCRDRALNAFFIEACCGKSGTAAQASSEMIVLVNMIDAEHSAAGIKDDQALRGASMSAPKVRHENSPRRSPGLEFGHLISPDSARRLVQAGLVSIIAGSGCIDFAGAIGTAWTAWERTRPRRALRSHLRAEGCNMALPGGAIAA
jgi:hypothetical protein